MDKGILFPILMISDQLLASSLRSITDETYVAIKQACIEFFFCLYVGKVIGKTIKD